MRFQGPVQEIRRLRERVKDPDFSLAVAVPPPRKAEFGLRIVIRMELTGASMCQRPLDPATKAAQRTYTQPRRFRLAPKRQTRPAQSSRY